MEVLNLATLEKQDEILSQFPISGGTDFGNYVTHISESNIVRDRFLALSIEGEGFLNSILVGYVNSSTNIFDVEIIADGVELPKMTLGRYDIVSNLLLSFKNTLEIYGHRTDGSTGGTIGSVYSLKG